MSLTEELKKLHTPQPQPTTKKVDLSFINKIPAGPQSKVPAYKPIPASVTPPSITNLRSNVTPPPQAPQGFVRSTLKTVLNEAGPAYSNYIKQEEQKKANMSLGQRFKYDIITKPAGVVKFLAQGVASVPLALGRSTMEAVGMEQGPSTPTVDKWEEKIFGQKVPTYQQVTRDLQQLIDSSPESTTAEKDFLAPFLGIALFASDALPGGGGKKKAAAKLFAELADDTNPETLAKKLIETGIERTAAEEMATKLVTIGDEKAVKNYLLQEAAERAAKIIDEGANTPATPSLLERIQTKVTPGKTLDMPEVSTTKLDIADVPSRKAVDVPEAPKVVRRVDEVTEGATERFFRSADNGARFDEIPAKDVLPAPLRANLDTYVVKAGDEYSVVEGRTGQQIGDPGATVAEAIGNAKNELANLSDENLQRYLDSSPLSPRYTQVPDEAPPAPKQPTKSLPRKLLDRVMTADKLKLTDKAAARRLAKLERMAETAPNVDKFVENSGITKPALDMTVRKQGYKNVDEFFETNKASEMDGTEYKSRTREAIPDDRITPDETQAYSVMADEYESSEFVTRVKTEEAELVTENLRAVFADLKGIDIDDTLKFSEEDLFRAEQEYEFLMDSLMDDPARGLTKYANKNGEVPEVYGTEFRTIKKNGKDVKVRTSEFGRRGDDIVKTLGFDSSEEARAAYTAYSKRRADAKEVLENLQKIRNSIRLSKQMNEFVDVNQRKLAAEFKKNRKALSNIVAAAERSGFRRGIVKGKEKYEKMVARLKDRRQRIAAIKWVHSLSDGEMTKAMSFAKKQMKDAPDDPRFMTTEEFGQYLDNMVAFARDAEEKRMERGIVKAIIEQKELKNTENLREVMELPTLTEMSLAELKRYEGVLNKFQDGDEFLSKRTLEVIDRTALKGARTTRQVQEFLAKEIKRTLGRDVEPGDLQNLTAGASDYLRWDTALAESKPFYGFMVHRAQKHMMDGETNFLRIQNRIEELAKKAKVSRIKANKQKIKAIKRELKTTTDPAVRKTLKKRMKGLGWRANAKQKLVPTYTRIIKYLESRGEEKEMFWKTLTKEEQEYASFIRNYYNSAYNYLSYINEIHGSRYIDAYFTHIRKGFLEKWSDDGFVAAIKNMWDAQKEDMAIANIIDSDTGKILPKSKFFQYTMARTGEGETSQNLTRVFLQYSKLLERKKMLDKMVPELDVYTNSLTPKELTPRGLEMDRTMKEFVNNWLNNKRGRRFNYGGIIKQNGPADIALRSGNALVSVMDLGLNFMAGTAALVGENVANFVALGNRGTLRGFKRRIWDTGMMRIVDPKASAILKQAEPFIGRNIWTELAEVDKPIIEKGMQTLFGLFGQSSVEANKIYLLGSITKEELKAGKLSAQRMADMKLDAGRWRDMGSNMKSIVGATSAGSAWTKYKTWAIPIMRTSIKDLTTVAGNLKKGEFKTAVTSKETREIMRAVEATTAALILGSVLLSEDDDGGALSKLEKRVRQEALTILGGVDPTVFFATPRLYSWMQQLAGNLKQIVMLEEYKTDSKFGDKGDLKGVGGLKQQFTPGFIRQFIPDARKTSETKSLDNLDKLDDLDKLDGLGKLDKLDDLDKLDSL